MEKPSYKLVGAPCGQHGQYTFYKAIKLTGLLERIVAIGDFFFVKIWQDSELISIGELQLLWTDRVSDQTLVSLRLYFLPENTPAGRGQHGEHEVLAINDKVVLRAEDLLSWVCVGREWRWGLRAVWRGDCAPPAPAVAAAPHTAPLHHTRLDFSDVEKEKSAITIDEEAPGVVVFSYPRYCRYRALVARLEGIQARWLRDSLVAALGGYAAPTRNTRILYCKDTFEYPELEGHEFVCNHMSPKLKGRPRGRRRRAADRSPGRSPARSDSRSSDSDGRHTPDNKTHRRLSLRNGPDKEESTGENGEVRPSAEDEAFMSQLIDFYRDRSDTLKIAHTLKHMSLRLIYMGVVSRGGYEAVCRDKLWRHLYSDLGPRVRRLYERCLLPFENHERRLRKKYMKGLNGKVEEKVDTIEVGDSPLREDKRLRTPSPGPQLDNETGEVLKDDITVTSKPAEELNREFLDSLPEPEKPAKISVKPVDKLIEPSLRDVSAVDGAQDLKDKVLDDQNRDGLYNDAPKYMGNSDGGAVGAAWRGPPARAPLADLGPLAALTDNHNGHAQKSRPAGRSSLRAVRVKPARPPPHAAPAAAQAAPTSSGPSPPNNFGIHHPPPAPTAPLAQPPAPPHSDDDIVEVPYKPKSPEIIDLDEYPESPQAIKRKKLDILKERGLEVTAVPPAWGVPLPGAVPLLPGPLLHPLLAPAQLYQMYNILPPAYPNGAQAPKVIQAVSAFGTAGPEKTVYGNPKDPFMPPPHVLGCAPVRPRPLSPPARDVLDLTCPATEPRAPTVEIVRVPPAPSPARSPAAPAPAAQNLAKNYTLLDGKAVVGSNLEITLVDSKAQQTPPKRPPQKRNSNGKFAAKTPTPPKDYKYPPASPSGKRAVPYPARDESPTSSTGSRDSASSGYLNAFKAPSAALPFDPLYVSSLYGGLGQMDQRQLAMYRDFVASQFRGYSGLLNIGPPTTKN